MIHTVSVYGNMHHIEIPDGWEVIEVGNVKQGDMIWNGLTLDFLDAGSDEIEMEIPDFWCVIRKQE